MSFLLHGQAHPVLKPKYWTPPMLKPPISPARAAVSEEKKKKQIKFCYASAQASKSFVSKLCDVASDSKLRPQAKFPR